MMRRPERSTLFPYLSFFFFNDTATTEIYTLSLHRRSSDLTSVRVGLPDVDNADRAIARVGTTAQDRKSTRLNSSHGSNSYAVFCLKQKILGGPGIALGSWLHDVLQISYGEHNTFD